MASISWGFLSTARINGALLYAGLKPHAVASRSLKRAEQYAQACGIPFFYGSYEDLLANPDIDAVYVSLPNALHISWVYKALEAGKHVLCEKPLSANPEAVDHAYALAKEHNLLLREAFMWRYLPQTRLLKRLLDEKHVGAPKLVRATFSFFLHDKDDVRLQQELDGGSLMDLGCYGVNAARLVAGSEPVSGYAEKVFAESGVDLSCFALLKFPQSLVAQIDCSFAMPSREKLEIICSEGMICVRDPWRGIRPRIEVTVENTTKYLYPDVEDPYLAQIKAFERDMFSPSALQQSHIDATGQAAAIKLFQ